MEQELAFRIEDRFITIQSVDEGYDYTIMMWMGRNWMAVFTTIRTFPFMKP